MAAAVKRTKANAVSTTAGGITDIAKAPGEVNPAINTASKNNIRQTAEDSQEKTSEKVKNTNNKTPMADPDIKIYAREEVNYEKREADDSVLSGVREVREGTRGGEDLRQVPGRNPEEVQREMGRHAGRDGDRRGVPGLREGEGSVSLDAPRVAENHRGPETRGGEGEGVKNQLRDPRLSDRDVLRMAADMAQRDRSQRWSVEDLNRFDLLRRKLGQLDEANAELAALQEERNTLLTGRKAKELKKKRQQTSSSSAACFCNIRYTAGCSRRTRRGW